MCVCVCVCVYMCACACVYVVIGSKPMFLGQQMNQMDWLKMKQCTHMARRCFPNNLKLGS